MSSANEERPFDPKLTAILVAYADQFALAVKDGHEIVSAAAAQAIVQSLIRFSPGALSRVCSTRAGKGNRPDFISAPSRRKIPPDIAYLSVVQPAVMRFKEALASGDVEKAIEALIPTEILAAEEGPQVELRDVEMKLIRLNGVMRLQFLPRVAKLAFWTGDIDKAEEYATEAVLLEPVDDPSNEGEAAHDGNMVLGLIALRDGNIEMAKQHLLTSVRTGVSGALTMTGPNLSLANELLKRNEIDVVIIYLQECKRFWVVGRKALDVWIEKLRRGEQLEFDPVHLSL